jgi:L-ribulose-5-phosphate 3-epimerase
MNVISFMSANFVARQLNYNMPLNQWMAGDRATQEWFRPLESFEQRFDELLGEVAALGFSAIDIWLPHLHPNWATSEHIATAQLLLTKHNLQVASLAGGFGNTRDEVERSCLLANALGTTVLGGNSGLLKTDRKLLVAILKHHGVRLGIENHPEKTPQELLEKINASADHSGEGTIGAAVDTGWFGTQGFDAALALLELRAHLFHIHLKDVRALGGHETCRLGKGVVPIRQCIQTLRRLDYTGALSVEHEPEHFDPREDCRAGLKQLQRWLAE